MDDCSYKTNIVGYIYSIESECMLQYSCCSRCNFLHLIDSNREYIHTIHGKYVDNCEMEMGECNWIIDYGSTAIAMPMIVRIELFFSTIFEHHHTYPEWQHWNTQTENWQYHFATTPNPIQNAVSMKLSRKAFSAAQFRTMRNYEKRPLVNNGSWMVRSSKRTYHLVGNAHFDRRATVRDFQE